MCNSRRIISIWALLAVVFVARAGDDTYVTPGADFAAEAMEMPAEPVSVDSQIREQQIQEQGINYREVYRDAKENAPNLGPNAPGYIPPPPD